MTNLLDDSFIACGFWALPRRRGAAKRAPNLARVSSFVSSAQIAIHRVSRAFSTTIVSIAALRAPSRQAGIVMVALFPGSDRCGQRAARSGGDLAALVTGAHAHRCCVVEQAFSS
jgi:hypothetical protein